MIVDYLSVFITFIFNGNVSLRQLDSDSLSVNSDHGTNKLGHPGWTQRQKNKAGWSYIFKIYMQRGQIIVITCVQKRTLHIETENSLTLDSRNTDTTVRSCQIKTYVYVDVDIDIVYSD